MLNKKFLYLFLALFLISFASAELGTFKQDECMKIKTILNSTFVTLDTLIYPNNSIYVVNTNMTGDTTYSFSYDFCATNVTGTYIYDFHDDKYNVYVNTFDVTYSGDSLTEGKAVLNSVMLGIMILFWALVLFFTTKLPSKNNVDEEGVIQISKLKYLRDSLFVVLYSLSAIILFLASNVALAYLRFQMFGKILFTLFQMMILLLIPGLLVWALWIMYSLIRDKQIDRYMKMGFKMGGNV